MGTGGIDPYKYVGRKKFNIKTFDTSDMGGFGDRSEAVDEFVRNLLKINKLQQKLYAERKEGVIFVFQAMDAAGKDGVIRTVFNTLSPHGVKEYCFKVPSAEESSHDYLWRFWSALPARGYISIFNRSYYEDVLVGKVHKLYENQILPDRMHDVDIIRQRYTQIKNFEKYLYDTGTRVIKIFLNVSKDEQARRFVSRIDTERKNWKISSGDIKERQYWDDYMEAFETMVNSTSTSINPWYVVPADHKWYARLTVSRIVLATLEEIDPQWPVISDDELEMVQEYRKSLVESLSGEYEPPEMQLPDFANPGVLAARIVENEERGKIVEQIARRKELGFGAVEKLLEQQPVIGSLDALIEAVANAKDNRVEEF
ncbi:MAG: polyphosphate kinase 2 family protein [Firmicutes bacterium]|nr:polyphosphate kinase 2 family protein [Bacillota bacterium]